MSVPRSSTVPAAPAAERSLWRAVALPSEHGGWSLTLEPVLLGLLVAHSWAGAALGTAALVAFLLRSPLKLAVIDARRGRQLERSLLARRFAVGELALVAGLGAGAARLAGWSWLVPISIAAPLVGVELWFDVRSRGRRFVPELCGAIGMASIAAAIVLAGGRGSALAAGVWLVLAARAIGAIPFVRVQIARSRDVGAGIRSSDLAQAIAFAAGIVAVVVDSRLSAGLGGLLVLGVAHVTLVRRPPIRAKVLGFQQVALGVALTVATAAGVIAS